MEITIREVRGRFVACLPGSERIGPTVDSHEAAENQVRAYAKEHGLKPAEVDLWLQGLPKLTEFTGTGPSKRPSKETDSPESSKVGATDGLPGKAVSRDDIPEGYSLRRVGLWYKLFDAKGEQVGQSKRKAEEALAFAE